jgi:hypothetical protein
MAYPYMIQGNNIIILMNNTTYTIGKTHVGFNGILDAIKANDWIKVEEFLEPKKVIINFGKGNVSIKGETFYWKDKEMHNSLTTRMIDMLRDGFPIEPMVLFMENLMTNPSYRAVNELYGFLEKNNLPITPDGHFLAYKKVKDDYKDVYSGKFDNSVGKIVEMERNDVDDNCNHTCSSGLHFCSKEYLSCFGGARTMILKINPRDVVSIPTDYGFSKGRCCRYEVIGELGVKAEDAFTTPVQENANITTKIYEHGNYDDFYFGDYDEDDMPVGPI